MKAALLGAKLVAPEPAAGRSRFPRRMACTRKSRPGVCCACCRKVVWQLCRAQPLLRLLDWTHPWSVHDDMFPYQSDSQQQAFTLHGKPATPGLWLSETFYRRSQGRRPVRC